MNERLENVYCCVLRLFRPPSGGHEWGDGADWVRFAECGVELSHDWTAQSVLLLEQSRRH